MTVSQQLFSHRLSVIPATPSHDEAIWKIIHEVVSHGDTYAIDPQIPRADALAYWHAPGHHVYVATDGHDVLGTAIVRENPSGDHVANAAFMVPTAARGCGVGSALCRHAIGEASRLGFQAMQFNFVVSTNTTAIALWQKFGFQIIRTLPSAFQHPTQGLVDALVMHRVLGGNFTLSDAFSQIRDLG